MPKDQYKVEYALVYFSDPDAVNRAMSQANRAKTQGIYMGSLSQIEVKHLNLKKSEQGGEDIILLSRVLEYIYITHKLRMLELCISFIDNFFRIVNLKMAGKFDLDLKSRRD